MERLGERSYRACIQSLEMPRIWVMISGGSMGYMLKAVMRGTRAVMANNFVMLTIKTQFEPHLLEG